MLKYFVFAAFLVLSSTACSDEKETPQVEDDPPGAPPKKWTPQDTELTRAFYDDDVAIYYDVLVDPSATWPFQFIGDVWRYVKEFYQVTPELRLYVIIHGSGGGGTVSYHYDAGYDYHNTLICWSDNLEEEGDLIKDVIVHEMFHQVETLAFGADSNSAGYGDYPNGIWGDSAFAPIFHYGTYSALGMTRLASQWKIEMETIKWDMPTTDTYWSRDWFLPIYENYGEQEVIREFFKLIGEQFPDDRKLNFGEFIHFFSGAAGADLKELAQSAFGWNETWEAELSRAREEFSTITYE